MDLDTGATLPTPALAASFPTPRVPSLRRRWWTPLVMIVVVAVAVLAGMMTTGAGPFQGVGPFDRGAEVPPELPDAGFEPSDYPGEAASLSLSSVATLTFRPPTDGRSFSPDHLADDDPATAWHSNLAAAPEGADEVVDLFLEDAAWVTAVIVHNGDHHGAAAYEASPRIRRVRMVFDGGADLVVTLLDLGREPQLVELPEPVLTTAVRIEVLSSVPGGPGTDVAVSEISLLGFVAAPDDREIARRRAELLPAGGPVAVETS